MAVTNTLTLEGTPGATLTLANSGATPQAVSGGNTAVFSTEAKAGGATGARFERVNGGNTAGVFGRVAFPASTPTMEFSGVWTATAAPSADVAIWTSRFASGRIALLNRRPSGSYEFFDQAGVYAPTALIAAGVAVVGHQYRFVIAQTQGSTANTGTVQAAVYDLTAGTTISSWTWTSATLTLNPFTASDFGVIGNVNTVALWDDMQYGNSNSMLPPLASNAAPTVTVSASSTSVEPGTTVTVTATPADSDGTISSVVFSSSTLTFAGSGNSRTFTAPPGLTDVAHRATVTVTDNGGATATASVDVTVLAATIRKATSSGMVAGYVKIA